MRTLRHFHLNAVAVAVLVVLALLSPTRTALADDTVKHPGDHPHYAVELEPHLLYGWNGHHFGNDGFGVGGRVSIPITHEGFIKTINNSVAISLGLDWLHYSGGCYGYGFAAGCYDFSTDEIEIPVAMQWNFYVAQHWSVFGEPGIYIWHAFFNDSGFCAFYRGAPVQCPTFTETGLDFAFWVGGRYHFSDSVSLTMRIGYPTLSVGVSFFP
jgi:hypothetical protein